MTWRTRIPAKPYKKPFPAVDRAFTKVRFRAGPAGKLETVYEQGETSHWYATRYRICKWWGERPLEPFAKESTPISCSRNSSRSLTWTIR